MKYLFTVPSGTDSRIIVSDGDPAEWADQFKNLHIENVNETTLESTALQEDFAAVFYALGAMHNYVDLWVGARTPHISSHHLYVVYNSYVDGEAKHRCKIT